MAIDMRQFHQTFFEESLEGLAGMETELLRLEKAAANNGHDTVAADPEILNTIFRAAHSIKGGSSTFGFEEVAAFASGPPCDQSFAALGRLPAQPDHLRQNRKGNRQKCH